MRNYKERKPAPKETEKLVYENKQQTKLQRETKRKKIVKIIERIKLCWIAHVTK